MRIFEGHDSALINPFPVKFKMKSDKCCCFCKNCTDVWWDYEGPYMMWCKVCQEYANESDYNLNGNCKHFIDEMEEI